jgi:PAS domain S-box-containing protein
MNRRSTISIVLALATLLMGIVVLIGWWIGDDALRSIVPGEPRMKVNTALAFILCSIVLLLGYFMRPSRMQRVFVAGLSGVVILIGLLTLVEYLFGLQLGIDEMLFRDETPTTLTHFAGRMSPISAINFLLIGIGLLLLNKPATASYQFIYLCLIGFTALLMLVGFNFVADIPTFIRQTIAVCTGFVMLTAAIYLAQPGVRAAISFETRLATGFLGAITLIVVIGIFSFYYNQKRTTANELVVHTKTVLLEVERTLSTLKDMEAGSRGYLITGDSLYLTYFQSAVTRIPGQINLIKELTDTQPVLQARIDSLASLINLRIAFANYCTMARNQEGMQRAFELMTGSTPIFLARRIREVVGEIVAWENNLLDERHLANDENIDAFNRAYVIFFAGVFVLMVGLFASSFSAITKRKKAEEALARLNAALEEKVNQRTIELIKNESRYRGIIDNGMDIISLLDKNFMTFYRSPSSTQLLGWTDEDRRKMGAMELVHPDDIDSLKSKLSDILANPGTRYNASFRAKHKEGHYLWLKGMMTNMLHDGSIGAIISNFRDVTEERMANERFRLVVEAAPNAMVLVNREGKITLVNVQAEKLFGYSREEMISQKVEMLLPSRFLNMHAQHREGFFMQHEARSMGVGRDLYALRKDGSEFPVEIGLSPIESPDGILVLASIIDISERKMQEANKLKSDFLANMSHELRTPMNAIIGFSELLIDKKAGELTPRQLDYLNDIHASGSHLLQLINDILDLSKIESGKAELHVEAFHANEIVEEVVKVLRPLAAKNSVSIIQKFSPGVGMIDVDKHKFRQILYNLISNGIKFNKTNGSVTVETHNREPDVFTLSVSDTGIGIPTESIKKLFVPFVQLDSGNSRMHEGSGLGLALVKNIVEMHGGEVKVASISGQGSTFTVTLPLR